jgi:uncharacterized protein (DUF305 family)
MCANITEAQTTEITTLKQWLTGKSKAVATTCPTTGGMMDMTGGCGDTDGWSTKQFKAENTDMHNAMAVKYTGDANIDFVRGMRPHHAGAVAMCSVLTNTCGHGFAVEASLAAMCVNVVASQSSEIATMGTWLTSRGHELTAACETSGMTGCGDLAAWSSKQFERVNAEMHKGMSIKFTGNPNIDFVRGMIAHHEGAVAMCKVLNNVCGHEQAVSPALSIMCMGITSAQNSEIATMKTWLTDRGESLTESCSGMMMMDMSGGCGKKATASSKQYIAANTAMHADMAIAYTCDPSIDFVRGMTPHHAGAIAMCAVLMNTSAHGATVEASLATMCTDGVVPSQTGEITTMNAWLTSRSLALKAECPAGGGMKGCGDLHCPSSVQFEAANAKMHKGMSIEFSGEPNEDFVRGMIAHHQGAIDMCAVTTSSTAKAGLTIDTEVAALCTGIVAAQTSEIATLSAWLTSRGKTGAGTCPPAMVMGCGDVSCWATKEAMKENDKMHADMAIAYTCDPNIDFIRAMQPHHAGAIAMCKVLMDTEAHGATVEASLATMCTDGVVPSQSAEIGIMVAWLTARDLAVTATCAEGAAKCAAAPMEMDMDMADMDMSGMAGMAGMQHRRLSGPRLASSSTRRRLDMHEMDMSAMAGCGNCNCWSSKELEKANARMMMGMSIKFTCDPNQDFVRGMIAHHQGAIDMCAATMNATMHGITIEASVATLCSGITAAQESEIAVLNTWLTSRSLATKTTCRAMGGMAGMDHSMMLDKVQSIQVALSLSLSPSLSLSLLLSPSPSPSLSHANTRSLMRTPRTLRSASV